MALFWKAAAAVLITSVLVLTLGKQQKDVSVVLSMAVCCMVIVAAVSYLEPVLDFLWEIESLASFQSDILSVLIKALGIGLVADVAGMVCNDAGNSSLGKTIQLLGNMVILYLSLPVFRAVLQLIQQILGEL